MTLLRAILVDDEPPARRWLRKLLGAYDEIAIVGEAESVSTAAELVIQEQPDLIFLDIQMPPGNGFDLLPLLRNEPRIIFVTAYDNYAVRAFQANALDYLLKPVHPDRLAETLRRLPSIVPVTTPSPDRTMRDDLMPLKDRGLLRMVRMADISAIQAEASYTKVWLKQFPPMMILRSIGSWEQMMPSPPFFRIDRSLLINLEAVIEVNRRNRDETLLTLQGVSTPYQIGRAASTRLLRILESFSRES